MGEKLFKTSDQCAVRVNGLFLVYHAFLFEMDITDFKNAHTQVLGFRKFCFKLIQSLYRQTLLFAVSMIRHSNVRISTNNFSEEIK